MYIQSMSKLTSVPPPLIGHVYLNSIKTTIFLDENQPNNKRKDSIELIKINQLCPISFNNAIYTTINEEETLIIKPKFQFFYYGLPYESIEILINGIISLSSETNILETDRIIRSYKGFTIDYACNWMNMYQTEIIKAFNGIPVGCAIKTINNDEYLAIEWSYSGSNNENNTENHVQVVCVLYANGNISIYFKKVPDSLENKVDGLMLRAGKFTDKDNELYYEADGKHFTVIKIPPTVVKSGTLIEYSPLTFCNEINDIENIPENMVHSMKTSMNIASDVVCEDIQNTECPITGCSVTKPINNSIEVSTNRNIEQTTNDPVLPYTFSILSYEQQLLEASQKFDVDFIIRRFTISLLLPFLLIATVLCIAFPLFIYRRQSLKMNNWNFK
ncbi:unnamed protein product [Schistosoma rodhaini]|uniref:Uncharacterized protein n=1 Tax=Schistosoma rodhaini TaxID=6188 RepID=A0AA85ESK9_9TREM|nr:unnamed protein product [Schistosoma rodhaini]